MHLHPVQLENTKNPDLALGCTCPAPSVLLFLGVIVLISNLVLDLPHCLAQDDFYRGMFIPKDSTVSLARFSLLLLSPQRGPYWFRCLSVIVNIWYGMVCRTFHERIFTWWQVYTQRRIAFSQPKNVWPWTFCKIALSGDPGLKLKHDPRKYVSDSVEDEHSFAITVRGDVEVYFARCCPGADLIESSIWLLIASMITTLDIKKAVDGDGNMIEPIVRYSISTFR